MTNGIHIVPAWVRYTAKGYWGTVYEKHIAVRTHTPSGDLITRIEYDPVEFTCTQYRTDSDDRLADCPYCAKGYGYKEE